MSDLIERLREHHQMDLDCGDIEELIYGEAADELERLQSQIAAMTKDMDSLEKQLEMADAAIERWKAENEELRKEIARAKIVVSLNNAIDGVNEFNEVWDETIAAFKSQSAEPVAREYMFNLMVEGKANEVYDTADEAVRMAMHHVYLSPPRFQEAVDTLKQGQVFTYSYGFSWVDIIPVAKRRINTTPPTAQIGRAHV